ncbi:MAG: DNA methyltransferase [Anaerolinea sp.]|nr:DNA methyltransferase [Anaerolinea sp.]
MPFLTPLRYPGGKGKLANFMKLVFRDNIILDAPYVEPFAGGAGVAIALLFDEFTSHIYINDINRSIYAFWHSVLNDTDALCQLIHDTPVTIEEWESQQSVQQSADQATTLELGFSTFFLNRTNRSGIIAGGVIGGKKQDGPYKLDARFNRKNLISRIQRIARFSNRISIFNMDAAQFIRDVSPRISNNALVYLDPPYYVKGQGLYQNYYEHDDHLEIARLVAGISQHWIVSYDNTPQIQAMYNGFRQIIYNLNYSAGQRYKGSEVMFFSDRLVIPAVENPALIPAKQVFQTLLPI